MRKADLYQLYLLGFGISFICVVVASNVIAQIDLSRLSQDAINTTLFERQNNIIARVDKFDTYLTAIIVATMANLIAHLINLKRSDSRRH